MKRVTIVGAGIVGICVGLYLQRDGHEVILVDPLGPAQGCSFGNGGLIQAGACVPIATPGVLRAVPRLMPYLVRFMAAARPSRVEAISSSLATLLSIALTSYRPLIEAAGAGALVQPTGELHIYESDAAFAGAQAAHDLRRRRGVRLEVLDTHELRRMEPALSPAIRRGVFLPEPEQTLDPYDFAAHLVGHFVRSGGSVLREKVECVVVGQGRAVEIVTEAGRRPIDQLVIAAGAHSGRFAAQLGTAVPLDSERGYHLMLPDAGVRLSVPLMSGDYRFALVQMTRGIRLVGTAELGKLDAPPNYQRALRLLKPAQHILPGLRGEGGVPWMGHRPSMPDSLPVICRSPRYANAYFAFGHGHLGLTLAAATGRGIADMLAGREPSVNMEAFHISRYRTPFWA